MKKLALSILMAALSCFAADYLQVVVPAGTVGPITLGGSSGSGVAAPGYSYGMWANYVNTNTVDITNGVMEVSGSYYSLSTNYTLRITAFPGAVTNYSYIYMDLALSTTGQPNYFVSTTVPTDVVGKVGMYCFTNNSQRLVDAVPTADGVTVAVFSRIGAEYGYCNVTNSGQINLHASGNPDGTWQAMNVKSLSLVVPVCARSVFIHAYNGNAWQPSISASENTGFSNTDRGMAGGYSAYHGSDTSGNLYPMEILLGKERNIKVLAPNTDISQMTILWKWNYSIRR